MINKDERILKKIQHKELDMLEELSRLLKANNIKFYLSWGTALGCVRHKGFIPWDDDIDLYIWGKDYPKLKKIFGSGSIGNLELHDFENCRGYPYVFPKIVASDTVLKEAELNHLDYISGLYIDIFPLQRVANNRILRYLQEMLHYLRYSLIRFYYYDFTSITKKCISKLVRKFINPDKVQKKIYKSMIQEKDSDYFVESLRFFERWVVKKSYFDFDILGKFEHLDMPLPGNYNEYLTHCYGDFMKLPEEKDRKSHHFFSILIIDKEKLI